MRALALPFLCCVACVTPHPELVVTHLAPHVSSLVYAPTTDSLYWFEPDAGRLMQLPVDGGPAEALFTRPGAHGLGAGPNVLVWAEGGEVLRLWLDGGAPVTLASELSPSPNQVTVLGDDVYFYSRDLRRVPLGGGPSTWVADSPGELVREGASTFLGADSVALLAERGGPSTQLTQSEWKIKGLAVADGALYWTTFLGRVGRVRVDGTGYQLFTTSEQYPRDLVLVEGVPYWAVGVDGEPGAIRRLDPQGHPETFAGGQAEPHALVVVRGELYWVDSASATLVRANPPELDAGR